MRRRSYFRRVLAATVLAAVALAGAAQTAGATGTVLNDQDRMFLQAIHQANLAEIAAGNLARSKGQSQQVKDLGAMMVTDHTKLDSAVRQVAGSVGVSLPEGPNAQQQALGARLRTASPAEFDALYVSSQVAGHEQAMALIMKELADGSDAAVRTAARDAAPVVEGHLQRFLAQAQRMGLPDRIDAGRTGALPTHDGLPPVLIGAGLLLAATGAMVVARHQAVLVRTRIVRPRRRTDG